MIQLSQPESNWRSPRFARIAPYRSICTRRGIFRKVSTKIAPTFFTSQLFESRAKPTNNPRRVAKKIPATANRIVLTIPTQSARPPVAGLVSIPSERFIPGSTLRKSNPVDMFLAVRLSRAWLERNQSAKITNAKAPIWNIHFTTIASR